MNDSHGRISVVIPTLNEGDNLVDTVGAVLKNSAVGDLEVIVVDDGSEDGSPERVLAQHGNGRLRVVCSGGVGIARARNAGAVQAGGNIIIFLDGHCYVPPDWLRPLIAPFEHAHVGMVGPAFTSIRDPRMQACGITWRDAGLENVWLPCPDDVIPVPFHIGACQAVRADAFRRLGGYDNGMTRWGSEDIELCLRMWLFGYAVYAQPQSLVYHLFRRSHPYDVDVSQVIYNKLRFVLLHFDEDRLARILRPCLRYAGAELSLVRLFASDTFARRRELIATRTYDLDWFCNLFKIRI